MDDLLKALTSGDESAITAAAEAVYPEMRRLAARLMAQEHQSHTLQPTALVNEALIRLLRPKGVEFRDQGHFYAVAAAAMRHVLVDHARRKAASKRGPSLEGVELSLKEVISDPDFTAVEVGEALSRLEEYSPRAAQIVSMRFFAGLAFEEIAQVMGMSLTTVERDWRAARAWLYNFLTRRI
jgi:RNA polymerase sigma-70 factor, ECF subfamily